MNPNTSSSAWYSHPAYQRFWDHYTSVMSWCHLQRQSYRTAVSKNTNYPGFNARFNNPTRSQQSYNVYRSTNPPRPTNPQHSRTPHQKTSLKRHRVLTPESQEGLTESETCEELEMEISAEMKEFLLNSQKYRLEREARKTAKASEEGAETRKDCTGSLHQMKATITEDAPKERPGVRRTHEMKELYGVDAAKIHGMETAMQLTFDKHCDRYQPKLWPIMPFNVKFPDS